MVYKFVSTRKTDILGRIALPLEIRSILNISEGTEMNITLADRMVIIEKHSPSCAICNKADGEFKQCNEKAVCMGCVAKLNK